MRVFYVAEAFGGGIYELVRIQANAAAERGHAVGVAYGVRPETPSAVKGDFNAGVELFPMPWLRRTLWAQLQAARALRPLARGWRPDVVHLYSSFAGVLGALVLDRGLKTVYSPQAYSFTMRSPGPQRAAYAAVERLVARRVDFVGAASEAEAETAQSILGARRVEVIENGIPELDDPLPPPTSERVKRVIGLGRLRPQRRPEACARILSQVADLAEVRWVGGGDPNGPEAASLERAGVLITGWLPRTEVLEQLASSMAYLHWTAWDGLALSVLEAMARDVVVVASDIGPNREALGRHQVCSSEAEATRLLRRVCEEPDLRLQFLTSQRARRQRYSAQRMVEKWIDVYERVSGESKQ